MKRERNGEREKLTGIYVEESASNLNEEHRLKVCGVNIKMKELRVENDAKCYLFPLLLLLQFLSIQLLFCKI